MNNVYKSKITTLTKLMEFVAVATSVALFNLVIFAGALNAQNVSESNAASADTSEVPSTAVDSATPTALGRLSDWLLRSSQQRRQQLVKESRFDELAERSGDDRWHATGQYRRGEYEEAAESYASDSSAQAAYNQATTLAHTGDYDKALELLDEVLAERPNDEDALHNKDIIEQLKDLAQQQQQQSGENGDDQQESEENAENSDQQQGESDQGEQSESDDASSQQDQQDGSEQQSSDESANADESEGEAGEQETESSADADLEQMRRDAQEAAAQQEPQEDLQQLQEQVQEELAAREEPLTEAEQATEQWLRQIPDDPSGLLRRKLQQSHRNDYPSVQDLREPW